MTPLALLLVVVAAVLHAVWNLITKKVNGKLPFFWLVSLGATLIFGPITYLEIVRTHLCWSGLILALSLASAVLHLLYFVVLQLGYRKADLSVVYPVARGAGPLFSVLGAILIFGERPGWMALVGVGLVVAGVLIMTGLRFQRGTAIARGLEFGTLTGLFIAAYTLWDKWAVVDLHVSALFITFASMLLPFLLLIPVVLKNPGELKREIQTHWIHALVVAIFQPLSYLLVLIALKTTPITYVAPARELSIVFGVFFGAGLLKERDMVKRMLAALVILVGIVLLALG
jgi:drug/metabolite transporter (DMT)-like permease